MKDKLLFILSGIGILLGCAAAVVFAIQKPAQPPLFNPASNPYAAGIYAEGIVESEQTSGSNISVYPEVPGTVSKIFVNEGQKVHAGQPLLLIDDSVQRATTEQQESQAQAAHALLEELHAQPRKENLEIAVAQVEAAKASLKTTSDELAKQQSAYKEDLRAVSKDALDAAINAELVAKANLNVAQRQYELTKAGAWSYDIRNQERQYEALHRSALSSSALLAKYTLHAPTDATVLTLNTAPGSYISPQGAYDIYTEASLPVLVLGPQQNRLHVRCYIDEILLSRLPAPENIKAQMTIRGTDTKIPLRFERIQPFVSPKIELSDQRQERVDVRVLPVIFSFAKPQRVNLYPGELVDVYLGN
ncbi:MAG TPA: biotin/lipoyl-binding protein [Acidobacteriaceae bacterium]|nr:biotin/lipoyl-binding protein [Acidobacteriaceae bacterium]